MIQTVGAASPHPLDGLDAVADGVAEIQCLAGTGFPFILLHDLLFHQQAAVDDGFDVLVHIPVLKHIKDTLVYNFNS